MKKTVKQISFGIGRADGGGGMRHPKLITRFSIAAKVNKF